MKVSRPLWLIAIGAVPDVVAPPEKVMVDPVRLMPPEADISLLKRADPVPVCVSEVAVMALAVKLPEVEIAKAPNDGEPPQTPWIVTFPDPGKRLKLPGPSSVLKNSMDLPAMDVANDADPDTAAAQINCMISPDWIDEESRAEPPPCTVKAPKIVPAALNALWPVPLMKREPLVTLNVLLNAKFAPDKEIKPALMMPLNELVPEPAL